MTALPAPQAKDHKIADIECLRAFAILFTLLAHYRFTYADTPAWIAWMDKKVAFHGGVDLFFAISGFVISKNLIPASLAVTDLAGKVRLVSQFWVRRIYRLWPSSWLWAFVGFIAVALTADRATVVTTVYDVASALMQVYNYHAYSCQTGVGACSHLAVGVYWSLSLEEQFYIVLPVLLVALRARAKWALVGLVFAAIGTHLFFPVVGQFFRWEAFCLGVLLGWLYANQTIRQTAQEHLFEPLGRFTWLAALLALGSIPLIGATGIGKLPYTLTAVCAAVLVALAAFDRGYLGIPRTVQAPLLWLGSRSYSIYLVHSAVFIGFKHFDGLRGHHPVLGHIGWVLTSTAVVFVLSELNFRFVESRFRHRASARAPRLAVEPVLDQSAPAS